MHYVSQCEPAGPKPATRVRPRPNAITHKGT